MFETGKPSRESRVACRYHGEPQADGERTVVWAGSVLCAVCRRNYVCEEGEEKRVYPHAPADGFCICGSVLFPNVSKSFAGVFSAQPKCDACARAAPEQQKTAAASP